MPNCLNLTLYTGKRFLSWGANDVKKLSMLCQELGGGHYSIDIVEVKDDPRRAYLEGVVRTPTVFVELSGGSRRNLGGLAETEKYLREQKGTGCEEKAVVGL